MEKSKLLDEIRKLEDKLEMWKVAINENRNLDFVVGYYFNETKRKFEVYVNNEHGKRSVRLATESEVEALQRLIKTLEYLILME